MNPNQFYQPRPPKVNEELPQECEDRAYWHKRFNFASWLFLIMGLWAVFFSTTPWSAMIGIGVSIGFRMFDVFCQVRHMMWHMKGGGGDMHI